MEASPDVQEMPVEYEELFAALRVHAARRHQCDWDLFAQDLDELEALVKRESRKAEARFEVLQADMEELLRRTPALDLVPASVTVTVH